jgi:hypothetical protein
MSNFINNGWLISLASIVITVIVTPWFYKLSDWAKARHGFLTGTYLALSESGGPRTLVAELIRCKHIGEKLKGDIIALEQITFDHEGTVTCRVRAAATYDFTGRMHARQGLINYWSTNKASQNGGTMTMNLDASGGVFQGIWCGTGTNGDVVSGPCMWITESGDRNRRFATPELSEKIEYTLQVIPNPWIKRSSVPKGAKGVSLQKMMFYQKALRPESDDQS